MTTSKQVHPQVVQDSSSMHQHDFIDCTVHQVRQIESAQALGYIAATAVRAVAIALILIPFAVLELIANGTLRGGM